MKFLRVLYGSSLLTFGAGSLLAIVLAGFVGITEAQAACPGGALVEHSRTINAFRNGECSNIIPQQQADNFVSSYDENHPNWSIYLQSWVSPATSPGANEMTVPAGTSSVNLQLNTLAYRGNILSSNPRNARQHFSNSTNPNIIVAGLRGQTNDYSYPQSINRYRLSQPISFNFALNPHIVDDQIYEIPMRFRAVTEYLNSNTGAHSHYGCVIHGGSAPINTTSLNNVSPCPDNEGVATIMIRVTSQWSTRVVSRLMVREPGQVNFTQRGADKAWDDQNRQLTTVPAGSQVRWQYVLQMPGTSKDQNFTFTTTNDRGTFGSPATPGFDGSGQTGFSIPVDSRANAVINGEWTRWSGYDAYTVTQDVAGNELCERVRWQPIRSTNGSTPGGNSTSLYNNCVVVEPAPNITPEVTASPQFVLPGDEPQFNFRVRNSGSAAASNATYSITYDQPVPGAAPGCTRTGNLNWLDPTGSLFVDLEGCPQDTFSAENLSGRLCATLTIQNPAPGSGSLSASACVTMGHVPFVQISGGDILVRGPGGSGGDVVTSSLSVDGRNYGSWSEYGIIASGRVLSASAGVLTTEGITGSPSRTALTFANTGNGTPGGFTQSPGLLSEESIMQLANGWNTTTVAAGTGRIGQGALNGESPRNPRVYNLNSGVFVMNNGSGAASPGAINQNLRGSYIIRSAGTIRIDNNIKYAPGPYSSPADMPQVIIIANRIHIQPGVENIDAWLIASEGISTCGTDINLSSYFQGLSRNHTCDRKLTINGMTQAGKILLRRVGGDDGTTPADRQAPAEVFNGRSDAYIWARGQAADQGAIRTDSVVELPPRF